VIKIYKSTENKTHKLEGKKTVMDTHIQQILNTFNRKKEEHEH